MLAQLEDEPDEGLSTFSATQQERKIAEKLAENSNDIKVRTTRIMTITVLSFKLISQNIIMHQ